MDVFEALSQPFPPHEIEWRVGSTNQDKTKGLALAYITARHVMDRLDSVVGPANWQDRYEVHGTKTICYLSVRIGGEWIVKADGAGDSDVEAEKGSISDALKRAAVKWGIGRYLYDLGNTWVKCVPAGRSVKIEDGEYDRLAKLLMDKFGKPADWVGEFCDLSALVFACTGLPGLGTLWKTARVQTFLKNGPRHLSETLTAIKDQRKTLLQQPAMEAAAE